VAFRHKHETNQVSTALILGAQKAILNWIYIGNGRWNIVLRSCIDGKSRTVVYLHASGDNQAQTNFESFLSAVSTYGVPMRTRSDKGGENVLIAKYMIETRGVGRASHICGRSVHNQR
jgi:hypothetical protein